MLDFITWTADPAIFTIGSREIRWYGLAFAIGFAIGYMIVERMWKKEGLPPAWIDSLLIYTMLGTVIGARLGHCFFYDWAYYSQHPLEIVLPFQFNPFKFTGFQGLASHGAAVGIIAGLWYYSRKVSKKSIFWILDRAVIPIALAGFFIRMGNLMNSEIIGKATNVPWAFQFVNASGIADPSTPRHPAQLYEAVCYLLSFGILMYFYWRTRAKEHLGFLFGLFLILIFSARFFIEFIKEPQEPWEADMALNMGQWLSIPFVIVGLFMIWYSKSHRVTESQSHKVKKRK
jgi:phosphatidylglycerol:prolipoprotein diacylglycerol transferase